MSETCETCRFMFDNYGVAECRKNAPVAVQRVGYSEDRKQAAWPKVDAYRDVCGEHQPKGEPTNV